MKKHFLTLHRENLNTGNIGWSGTGGFADYQKITFGSDKGIFEKMFTFKRKKINIVIVPKYTFVKRSGRA